MTQGEITSIVTVIGTFLTFLGITGVDTMVLSTAVQGIIALATIIASIMTFYSHSKAVAQLNAQ